MEGRYISLLHFRFILLNLPKNKQQTLKKNQQLEETTTTLKKTFNNNYLPL